MKWNGLRYSRAVDENIYCLLSLATDAHVTVRNNRRNWIVVGKGSYNITRSSAIAERPRDASCQLKSC